MKIFLCLSVLLLCNAFLWAQKTVLVYSKTTGFRHESILEGIACIQELGKEHHFKVITTENTADFNNDLLKEINLVLF